MVPTVGASANYLRVSVGWFSTGGETVSGVTFNGDALTAVSGSLANNGSQTFAQQWHLVNPDVTTGDIVVTFTAGGTYTGAGAVSYSGVDTSTPAGTAATATGTSTTPSVTVSAAVGDICQDATSDNNGNRTNTPGAGQTEFLDAGIGQGSTEAGAASVVMSWTKDEGVPWATSACAVRAVSAPYDQGAQVSLGSFDQRIFRRPWRQPDL